MSEFKVGGTCIYTTAVVHEQYTHYKIFYRLTWGYNAAKKNNKIKPNK